MGDHGGAERDMHALEILKSLSPALVFFQKGEGDYPQPVSGELTANLIRVHSCSFVVQFSRQTFANEFSKQGDFGLDDRVVLFEFVKLDLDSGGF